MKLIDKLRDISKPALAETFAHARDASADLGGGRCELTVTFGPSKDATDTFEDFEGMECSLTFTVRPANGS